MENILDFPSLNDLFCLKMYSEGIVIEDIPEKLVFLERTGPRQSNGEGKERRSAKW
jgi:hypothetical protein